ncbi:effector-associated constant component EACC1 [Nonomuraea sp. CA-143628]|uniref:effector-associated constant component EACC1 n=1 Tax=Nonomuraea sp. CA-143628 TaxID=3239997 RepID=UPI003D9391C9
MALRPGQRGEHSRPMEAEIRISGGDTVGELASLTGWLQGQRALAGCVRLVRSAPGDEQLGGVIELLSVAAGSGGAGVALVQALKAWLANRHSDVSITVTTEAGTVTVEAKRVDQALPLLRQVLAHQIDESSRRDGA